MGPLTEELVDLISADQAIASDAWLDLAERAFVDTISALFAGSRDPVVQLLSATLDEGVGDVRSMATGRSLSARSAALLDATSAHVLDFDDVDDTVLAHPSAVLVPASLVSGQLVGADGLRVALAYQVGLRACRMIARHMDVPAHYAAGWHATSTIGAIGATAAAAFLLDLGTEQVRHSLGIVGSLASGSRQNFGSMTKPLHAGMAASNGLFAASLASRGFTAHTQQLDAPLGFLAMYRGSASGPQTAADTSSDEVEGLNVKRYPCCYATHATIDAAELIAQTLPGSPEIVSIDIAVQPGGLAPLIHHRPTDGAQARFSVEYVAAAALLDKEVSLDTFANERVLRPDVQALLRKVSATDSAPLPKRTRPWAAQVSVTTADGEVRTQWVDGPVGHASRPLTAEDVRAKFDQCLEDAPTDTVDTAFHALDDLRSQSSIDEVVRALGAVQQSLTLPD